MVAAGPQEAGRTQLPEGVHARGAGESPWDKGGQGLIKEGQGGNKEGQGKMREGKEG